MSKIIRMEEKDTYVTLWGPIAVNLVIPWLKENGVAHEVLRGDFCEIPDGVQQYWERGGVKKYEHAICIKSRCNAEDLKDLSEELFQEMNAKPHTNPPIVDQ
ncbi:MAG: hypothetical protein LUE86_14195 [Clostridiales bacterium]|nr:hypothetical protein [Clostridiales bacterium]